jgi:hypothetical protein
LITPTCLSFFSLDPTSDYFNSKKVPRFRLGGCGIHVLRECFSFFLRSLQKRPSNFLFQIARGLGATPNGCPFFCKKCTPLGSSYKNISRFPFENYLDQPCFYPEELGRTRRFSSSTMNCSGACRYELIGFYIRMTFIQGPISGPRSRSKDTDQASVDFKL